MGRVKIFTQPKCPRCPAAKEMGMILKGKGVRVEFYDIQTPDGLAEAAFYSVQSTPAILVEDEGERVVAHWVGDLPTLQEVERVIQR